jgi:predicted lipid carrier protein YhbT
VSARRKPEDPTAEFFGALAEHEHNPLLEKAKGSVRFDLRDGKRLDHWLVSLDDGDLAVSRKNGRADCVVRTEKAVFDAIAAGTANGTAAVLRGAMTIDGDMELMVLFRRVFPAPPARAARTRRNGRRHR